MKQHRTAMALIFPVLLAACSSGGVAQGDVTSPTGAAEDVAGATASELGDGTEPGAGRIVVSSTSITGHKGHSLIVIGPGNESEVCATIDSDPWRLGEAALTGRAPDADPCTGSASDTRFEPGEHAVTAYIFVPGERTPLISTAALVDLVDGDAQIELDGSRLSATTGDPGRINILVSEITGQEGRILVVLGQSNQGSMCAVIDADSWTMPVAGTLTEMRSDDGGPCSEGTPHALFPAGDTRITAAVVVPGNQSPEASIDIVVPVDGDVTVTIDGDGLSG